MTTEYRSELKGIGGWLLLLCIILTFLVPADFAAAIGATNKIADATATRLPIYHNLVRGTQFIQFGFLCYCVYVGVSLWTTKKDAVAKAQRFFVAYVVFAAVRVLMPYLGDLPTELRGKMVDIYGQQALRTAIFSIVWHQYLARSVRVRNTFSR